MFRLTTVLVQASISFSAAVFALAPASQAAETISDWKNVGPLRSNDLSAFVDYKVRTFALDDGGLPPQGPSSYQVDADQLWVNVKLAGLSAADQVWVQLISYEKSCYRGQCAPMQTIVERGLEFAETGRFTGQMKPVTLVYQKRDGYGMARRDVTRAELVIWVNGKIYKDPAGFNLGFQLTR